MLSECSGTMGRIKGFSSVYLRLALGLSFLSAIADRFGLWGVLGKPNAAWGTSRIHLRRETQLVYAIRDHSSFSLGSYVS